MYKFTQYFIPVMKCMVRYIGITHCRLIIYKKKISLYIYIIYIKLYIHNLFFTSKTQSHKRVRVNVYCTFSAVRPFDLACTKAHIQHTVYKQNMRPYPHCIRIYIYPSSIHK